MLKRQLHRMFIQLCIHCIASALLLRVLCAVLRDAVPMPVPVPLDDDVSLPLAAGRMAQCNPPPGGTGTGRGGGMALRASGTPIYILIYILRFISLF